MSDTEADRVEEENRQAAADAADAAAEEEQARRIQEENDSRAADEANQAAERAARQAEADAAAEEERASRLAAEKKAAADAEAARKAAQAEALRASEAERAAQIEEEKKAGAKKPNAAAAAVKKEVSSAGGDALQAALGRLTDGKAAINYVMLEVSGKRGAVLSVADEGTGGFAEMLGKLDEAKVYFIGIKVLGVDERNVSSTRTKYAVATYIGTKAPMMVKAGAATTKAKLTQAWSGITLYYAPPDLASFTTEDLKNRLLACGGAHKPSYYDFGDGTRINLGFYSEQKNQGN